MINMPIPTGPTNEELRGLIEEIRKKGFEQKSGFLLDIARHLSKPRRQRVEVNVGKLQRFAEDDKWLVVPGKILSSGEVKTKINVVALSWSAAAEKKIKDAGGQLRSIEEFVKNENKFSNTKIII
jgi:large subunit ribosomal protein L18e